MLIDVIVYMLKGLALSFLLSTSIVVPAVWLASRMGWLGDEAVSDIYLTAENTGTKIVWFVSQPTDAGGPTVEPSSSPDKG